MSEIQGHKSNEISPLDRINDEHPPFIIEIAGEPGPSCQNQRCDHFIKQIARAEKLAAMMVRDLCRIEGNDAAAVQERGVHSE